MFIYVKAVSVQLEDKWQQRKTENAYVWFISEKVKLGKKKKYVKYTFKKQSSFYKNLLHWQILKKRKKSTQDGGKLTLTHCRWSGSRNCHKALEFCISLDLVFLLLGMTPKTVLKDMYKERSLKIFIVALFMILKIRLNQKFHIQAKIF